MPEIVIRIEPMGKPRMTQQDKWKKRPATTKYWKFKDMLKLACRDLPRDLDNLSWDAYFSMPKSWSKVKKEMMAGKLHQSKPDRDNIDKAILDALFEEDSIIAWGSVRKLWDDGKGARIVLQWT